MSKKYKINKIKSRNKNTIDSALVSKLLASVAGLGYASASMAISTTPQGGTLQAGAATILPYDSVNHVTEINQTSQKAIIQWSSFNVGAGELVKFTQGGSNYVILNKDVSGSMSTIAGAITAQGNVFLVNPAGVVFGAGSSVNVNGLLATSLDIDNNTFMNSSQLHFSGLATAGSVINQGNIQAGPSGYVYLIAPVVDNQGVLTGNLAATNIGTVRMAAGNSFDVTLSGSSLINFSVSQDALTSLVTSGNAKGVSNSGSIEASQVYLTANQNSTLMSSVVNNTGVIEADNLVEVKAGKIQQQGLIYNTSTTSLTPTFPPAIVTTYTPTPTVTLEASDEITTSSSSVTRAGTLNLTLNKQGAALGASASALRIDADTLNAQTNQGNIYIEDTAGDLTVSKVDTGAIDHSDDAILTSAKLITDGGSILQGSGMGVRAGSLNLVSNASIGSSSTALKTETGVLLANAGNGGIYLNNAGSLVLGKVAAQQAVTTTNTIGGQTFTTTTSASLTDDGSGKLTLLNNTTGTNDVQITTTAGSGANNGGDIVLTDALSATNQVKLTSAGSILYATSDDPNTQPSAPYVTGHSLYMRAQGDIGQAGSILNMQTEKIDMGSATGGVYVKEANGLDSVKITAKTNASVAADNGNITIDSIFVSDPANPTTVSVTASKGSILVGTGAPTNIKANTVNLLASNFIGQSQFQPLSLDADSVSAEIQGNKGIFLSNSDLLDSLTLISKGGPVNVGMNGGSSSLTFDKNSSNLTGTSITGMGLNFTNSAGDVVLNGVGVGSADDLAVTAAGKITQTGSNPAVAKSVMLNAGTGIGSGSGSIKTQTADLTLKTMSGGIYADDTSTAATALTASTGNGNVVVTHSGDLNLRTVAAAGSGNGSVTVTATGGAIKSAGTPTQISATGGATLSGSSIGDSSAPIQSVVNGNMALTATNGGIWVNNRGTLTGFGADASGTGPVAGGDINFNNTGDVAFNKVLAPGKNISINITGKATDANDSTDNGTINFASSGFNFSGASFGADGNRMEIYVDSLTINTSTGGIYAYQRAESGGQPKTLSLKLAQANGQGADIKIETDGNMDLGVVKSPGNAVVLKSGGVIADARVNNETRANVSSKSLDISAAGGIQGKNGGNLSTDVAFLSASGGTGAVAAENQSSVALDAQTLTSKAGGAISIIAPDITILDDQGNLITINGGSLTLTATKGNIVFLDGNDTIKLTGGGNITLSANAAPPTVGQGYSGVIVAGNLTTDNGGNISLSAESNITIGMLDAGSSGNVGNVTVASNHGIIIDGNGTAQNIRGNNVKLIASTPSVADAEFNRTTAAAEYSAQTTALGVRKDDQVRDQGKLDSDVSLQATVKSIRDNLQNDTDQLQSDVDSLSDQVDSAQSKLDTANTVLGAAGVARNAAAVIAGAAQAVPFSGDAGADAAFAVVDLALSAAQFTVDRLQGALDDKASDLADKQLQLNSSSDRLFSTNANLDILNAQVKQDQAQLAIDDQNVFRATYTTAAWARVRDQATTAYTLNKDIDSSSSKPLGITANRLDINDGGTVNTSLYLDSSGSLGLGNITLDPGKDLVVGVPVGSSPSVGVVQDNIYVVGNVNTSNKLDASGAITDRGTVTLKAGKSILDTGVDQGATKIGKITTSDLIMIAGTGIGAGDAIDIQAENIAASGGSGGVNIENVSAAALNVTTLGDVTGVAGDGDIAIKTDADLNLKQLVSDSNLATNNTITLTSTGGSVVDANLGSVNTRANTVVASAKNDIELDTDANILDASTSASGTGNILIREVSDIFARNVSAGNGNVDITAKNLKVGAISATATDTAKGNVTLTANDTAGRVDDDNDNSTKIKARKLTITANGAVGGSTTAADESLRSLDTDVDTINVTAGGVVNVSEKDDINVAKVSTTGDVTLQSATGSLNIGQVTTNTSGTTITLFATQGAITDNLTRDPLDANGPAPNLVGANLAMKAKIGIGAMDALDVKVAKVEAETDTGGINLIDRDGDLAIADVTPGLNLTALNGVKVSTSGDISIEAAAGALKNDLVISGSTSNVTLKAKTSISQNANISAGTGDIKVTASDGSITMATDTKTSATVSGDIDYTASSDIGSQSLYSKSGDITLLAGNSVSAGKEIDTDSGDVSITATNGSITTDTDAPISATGDVTLKAKTDVTQNANITTDSGDIKLTATAGDITMATDTKSAVNAEGDVSYTAGNDISTQSLYSKSGDITLLAANDVTVGKDVETEDGQVSITATAGSITTESDAPVTATADVTLTAATDITQNAKVSTDVGTVSYTATTGDIAQNADISTNTGDIKLTATAGDITMATDTKSAVNTEGDVSYSAGRNVVLAKLETPDAAEVTATNGTITVQSATSAPNVKADTLAATAANGIATSTDQLKTDVNKLTAEVTSSGDIYINEKDGVELTKVKDASGSAYVTAGGDVTVQSVDITGGDANITTSGSLSTLADGTIKANTLNASAVTGVDVDTDVSKANVNVSGTGELILREKDDVSLADLVTAEGDVTVTAGGKISVDTVSSSDNVSLESTGANIVMDRVDDTPAQSINGKELTLTAKTGIGETETPLTTNVEKIVATTTDGNIVIAQAKAVSLETLTSGAGKITIDVAAGDATVGTVTTTGNVALTASNGSLLDDGVTSTVVSGNNINLAATQGIGSSTGAFQTKGTTLDASVTAAGAAINIEEQNGLDQVNASTTSGDIKLRTLNGNLGIGLVQAPAKIVTIIADNGAVSDADSETDDNENALVNIIADHLDVSAKTGIGQPSNSLDVDVASLGANTQSGGIYVSQRGSAPVTLDSMQAAGGDISVKAKGDVIISDTLDNTGGSISVSTSGDISQNANISVAGSGNVSLTSDGSITMDPAVVTKAERGGVSYNAQDNLAVSSIETTTGFGGGQVSLNATRIIDQLPGQANVKTWLLDMSAENAGAPLVYQLLGDKAAEAALISLNYRIVGGTLAESRLFMSELLQPLQFSGNSPADGALSGSLNPVSPAQLRSFTGFVLDADGNWVFKL